MRKFILVMVILAAIGLAVAAWLLVTAGAESRDVTFPLRAEYRDLLAHVPASADAFALIPSAAAFHGKLLANPVTREPVATWTERQQLPSPWMLGAADVAVWRDGKTTSYAVRVDPLRALLIRGYLLFASGVTARISGNTFLMNAPVASPMPRADLDELLALGSTLPAGDVFAVQRSGARGAFPPIGRPAVTTARVTPDAIEIVSKARGGRAAARPFRASFRRGALISATFNDPPRIVDDLNRLTGARLSTLLADGGSIALYGVNARTLLPSPKGVIAVPATPERRAEVEKMRGAIELVGKVSEAGDRLLISLDRSSTASYLADAAVDASWPATEWAARLDAARMVPVVNELGDSTGLRIAAPRVHRAARDLRRWTRHLAAAESIEAASSSDRDTDELRVRIVSK